MFYKKKAIVILLVTLWGCNKNMTTNKFLSYEVRKNQTLKKDSTIVSYWYDLIGNKWNYFEKCNCPITKEDYPFLKFHPITVYKIDSIDFARLTPSTNILANLRLVDKETVVYAFKDTNCISVALYPIKVNGTWENFGGYGCVSSLSNSKTSYFIKSKIDFFCLQVFCTKSNSPIKKYYCFIENGKLMTYKYLSKEKIELQNELLNLKKEIKNNPNSIGI